jgi:hypothetical protein
MPHKLFVNLTEMLRIHDSLSYEINNMTSAAEAEPEIWRARVNSVANKLYGAVILIDIVTDKVPGLLDDVMLLYNRQYNLRLIN